MLKRWLLGVGLAALLVGITSSVVQAGVSVRLNIGVPVTRYHHGHPKHIQPKHYHHRHPALRHPRLYAPRPFIVTPPSVGHRPSWVPGRWQWTPWGWHWSGGYWVQ